MNSTELCRVNQTTILKAIAETGQARIAERLGVSESTISRYKDADIERFAAVLAAVGLKAVPMDWPAVDRDHLNAITVLAREALRDAGWNT